MKKYRTKRRKNENTKRLWILSVTVIGIASIGISYIGNITPTQVLAYDTVTLDVKHTETSVTAPQSLQSHVWNLLLEEMSFEEAMVGMAIVHLESHWDAYAIGDSGQSVGLWQIHKPSHPNITTECRIDVYCSTRAAIAIYKTSGWYPWSVYKE